MRARYLQWGSYPKKVAPPASEDNGGEARFKVVHHSNYLRRALCY
jgi:hypothetical protein